MFFIRYMNTHTNHINIRYSWFFISSVVFLVLFAFSFLFTVSAQSANDVEITEVMYSPHKGGEWIEIINTSSAAVDLSTLKVGVNDGTKRSISTHGTTTASLAAGAVAVIAASASDFSTAYSGYSGPLYSSSFTLPDTNGTGVALYASNGATKVHAVTYNTDARANGTGISLHVGLNARLVAAPPTPGEIAVNPIESFTPITAGVSVSSSIANGTAAGDLTLLDTGDVITLRVFHASALPSGVTAKISIGAVERTMTASSGATAINKEFTYTVAADDPSGRITYTIKKGSDTLRTGAVTHDGNPAVIDTDTPSVAFSMTAPTGNTSRKKITATITDTSPPTEVSYKMHTSACADKAAYDGVATEAKTVPVVTETDDEGVKTHTATINLFGSDNNNKYVCMKVTDLANHTAYSSSDEITGITALTVEISEMSYVSTEGGEWIEIVNSGSSTITVVDDLAIVDGGSPKSITHRSGGTTIANGDVAVIVKNGDLNTFRSEYPSHSGPLFTASISLTDSGETIGLRSGSTVIDSVTYKRSNGAYKNGKTLHILSTGEIVEGAPTPGIAAVAGERVEPPEEELVVEAAVQVDVDRPVVDVREFDGKSSVTAGQNIFFTTKDSVTVKVKIADNDTRYSSSNVSDRVSVTMTATDASAARYEKGKVTYGSGNVYIVYTVHFSPASGVAKDNRVKLSFAVTDDDDTMSSKRNVLVFVRNTSSPTLISGTSASVLGFAGADSDNVVVPTTVSGIQPGDWLSVGYNNVCGDGLLKFMVRNGGYGVPYELDTGRYESCTITVTDTAGNASSALTLPTVIVGG